MPKKIKVYTWLPAGRKFYYAQWVNPLTGKEETRSTKCESKRDAERWAGKKEDELNGARPQNRVVTWKEIREEYEADVFSKQAPTTHKKTKTTLDAVESILGIKHVSELTATDVLRFQREIRKRDVSEWTVKGHLSIFRKVLRWARRMNMISYVVEFPMPRPHHAKGRAPTGEEYERMLSITESIVGKEAAPSWNYLLEGLWWSGLRLSEAMTLRWSSDNLSNLWINLEESPPMFHLSSGFDKTRRDRIFPVAREFAEFLQRIPKAERKGFVFNPRPYGRSERGQRPSEERVGKTIAVIGEDAGIKVAERKRKSPQKQKIRVGEPGSRRWQWVMLDTLTKHATAHDLRRAFGFRWALRVLPPVLMELMRHESIQTTQQFYVGRNAAVAAREAWRAADPIKTSVHQESAELPNTSPNTSPPKGAENLKTQSHRSDLN